MKDVELLVSAAIELAAYITEKNLELMGKVSSADLDMPELHDFQTCHELQKLAQKLKDKT